MLRGRGELIIERWRQRPSVTRRRPLIASTTLGGGGGGDGGGGGEGGGGGGGALAAAGENRVGGVINAGAPSNESNASSSVVVNGGKGGKGGKGGGKGGLESLQLLPLWEHKPGTEPRQYALDKGTVRLLLPEEADALKGLNSWGGESGDDSGDGAAWGVVRGGGGAAAVGRCTLTPHDP
jgi:hypothetical protein